MRFWCDLVRIYPLFARIWSFNEFSIATVESAGRLNKAWGLSSTTPLRWTPKKQFKGISMTQKTKVKMFTLALDDDGWWFDDGTICENAINTIPNHVVERYIAIYVLFLLPWLLSLSLFIGISGLTCNLLHHSFFWHAWFSLESPSAFGTRIAICQFQVLKLQHNYKSHMLQVSKVWVPTSIPNSYIYI